MSGRRHRMDSTGVNYENCVRHLLGRIASLVHVPCVYQRELHRERNMSKNAGNFAGDGTKFPIWFELKQSG
jgi:hypothetical protein